MLKLHQVLFIIALSSLFGCSIQLDENFVDVDPTPKATMTGSALQLSNLMTLPDTFEITRRNQTFKAELKFDNAEIGKVKLVDHNDETMTTDWTGWRAEIFIGFVLSQKAASEE